MLCYFCETEARGICIECGRGICKAHGNVQSHERSPLRGGALMSTICYACTDAKKRKT